MLVELVAPPLCGDHVGEVHPPRCVECARLTDAADGGRRIDAGETSRLSALLTGAGYIPGSECPIHPNYPLPCDRCQRDQDAGDVSA